MFCFGQGPSFCETDRKMKRDMDLVRDLLLKLEAEPFDGQSLYGLEADCLGIEGPSYEDLAYHLTLLIDAGWLDAEREQSGPVCGPQDHLGRPWLPGFRAG